MAISERASVSADDAAGADPTLIDQLLASCLQRIDAGGDPDIGRESSSHPDAGRELAKYFEMANLVERAAAQLETRLNSVDGTVALGSLTELRGYEIRGEVGRGGMGIVYKAFHARTDRDVALKMLPPALAADPVRLARFKQEAAAAGKLTASHVLPIFDVIEDGPVPIIVMPLVNGGSLDRILAQRAAGNAPPDAHPWLSLPEQPFVQHLLAVADQAVQAVAAIHKAGVLHRDIKPSNILVDRDGTAWLSDFGLARLVDSHALTNPGDIMGTLGYMSPEQTVGAEDIDQRADLFSLGVTIYQALTLQLPYGKEFVREVTPLPRSPTAVQPLLSADFDAVILKAIHPERAQRYASVAEFAEDWGRVRTGLLPKARRVTRLHRARRWLKQNRTVSVSITLALAGLSFGAVALALLTDAAWGERQTVVLDTVPSNASVAFIPLDEQTGEPVPERIVKAEMRSPVRQSLLPGDYLVVVSLEDGRFHEVFRHVPVETENSGAYLYPHLWWDVMENGDIRCPSIAIPPLSVLDTMAPIAEGSGFRTGEHDKDKQPIIVNVPALWIDPTEATVAQCREVAPGGLISPDQRFQALQLSDDHAVTVPCERAVYLAELMGKRLPTAIEYQFVATSHGATRFPWGDTPPEELGEVPETIGPVRDVPFDMLPTEPPVFGLCSNVAEVTCTWRHTARDDRVVCGGNSDTLQGSGKVTAERREPSHQSLVGRFEFARGLGFRCVRSVKPRLAPEDFARSPQQNDRAGGR